MTVSTGESGDAFFAEIERCGYDQMLVRVALRLTRQPDVSYDLAYHAIATVAAAADRPAAVISLKSRLLIALRAHACTRGLAPHVSG